MDEDPLSLLGAVASHTAAEELPTTSKRPHLAPKSVAPKSAPHLQQPPPMRPVKAGGAVSLTRPLPRPGQPAYKPAVPNHASGGAYGGSGHFIVSGACNDTCQCFVKAGKAIKAW